MFRRFEMLWRCTTARTASGRRETGDCRLVVGGLDGEVVIRLAPYTGTPPGFRVDRCRLSKSIF